ncbi:hypothetical protein D0T50_09765 [Bacteroides sp. 214]|uniref:hypothetical protein n=1 Tax=Bacteroides sp. 214 TaxID=2302935 RepID=UPI0013D2EA58|nr:hypothetical protein [Bacteroides sp. 214]NDW13180.1 hypothetical protein [Bacteroides sp. 214]
MIQITDTYYIADEGKWFSRVADSMLFGAEIYLGMIFRDINGSVLSEPIQDAITNYTEIDMPEDYFGSFNINPENSEFENK